MRKRLLVLLPAFAFLLTGCSSGGKPVDDHVSKAISGTYRFVLESPDTFELLTIACDGEELPEGANGEKIDRDFRVVDRRKIEDPDVRDALVGALYTAISREESKAAACFDPHHGIRATRGSTTVTILVCFACANFHIWPEGGNGGNYIDVDAMQVWKDEVKNRTMLEVPADARRH